MRRSAIMVCARREKYGGEYAIYSGIVKKINGFQWEIIMQDGKVIPMDQISRIQGKIFD